MAQRDAGNAAPRAEPFGFTCSRCLHCCRDKRIQINPYEIARLSRSLGIGTTEFRARHTEAGNGTCLAFKADGACEFLGPEGCAVHADRPLVCRLYPLGRHIRADGVESFSHVPPHPLSRGRFDTRGTIGSYLEAQGTAPFIRAADAYFEWLCRAGECLDEGGAAPGDGDTGEILDMDVAIHAHCTRTGEPEPHDVEDRRLLHMKILDGYLNSPTGETP